MTKPTVKLSGIDGNAFSIIAKVCAALKRAGLHDQIEEFTKEATAGDYDHLLQTVGKYINVE